MPKPPPAEAPAADQVRVNFLVPAELRQVWKVTAAQRGMSIKDLVIQAMEIHLAAELAAARRAAARKARAVKASGGG